MILLEISVYVLTISCNGSVEVISMDLISVHFQKMFRDLQFSITAFYLDEIIVSHFFHYRGHNFFHYRIIIFFLKYYV